ncbi:TRAP transporter large permease subunit, partial [Marinomonas arenicola]|uniref:TRAP transporter large permease subunit n=1 Tax=Marinomonas arenicola TaxID=569601 RepID=UPI00311F29AF
TNTSVGDLFLAGVIPGLLLGSAFLVINYLYVRKVGIQSQHERASVKGVLSAFWYSAPALIAPFIIESRIVFGFVTPTESGALIVAYAIILG